MYFHDSTLPEAGNQDFERTATRSDVIIGLYAFSSNRRERFCRAICRLPSAALVPLAQFDYPAEDAAIAAYKPVGNIVR
jgi:hypothetical protein